MARVVRLEFGTLLKVDKRRNGEYGDWRSIKDQQGMIVICASERKFPGKLFASFFYTDGEFMRYLKTGLGDNISRDPKKFTLLTRNSVYHFLLEHSLTEREKMELFYKSGIHRLVSGVSFDLPKS